MTQTTFNFECIKASYARLQSGNLAKVLFEGAYFMPGSIFAAAIVGKGYVENKAVKNENN